MKQYKLEIGFCHPKYWLAWSGILALFISSLLPYGLLLFIGKQLGRLSYYVVKSRRHIARRNIELCFPALSKIEVEEKVRLNFENSGIALFEMGMAWFWPSWRIRGLLKISGREHLQQAKDQGKGILFMGAHFLTLEMGARALGLIQPCSAVYRAHSNAVLDYWFYWGRMREHNAMLDRRDLKAMLRVLKKGEALWYAPDHDYGAHKSSVFAPFFEVENSNTVAGTSTLARVKNSCVIPVFLKRLPGELGYELVFYKALDNFPTKDLQADTHVTNQQIEKMVLECDDQYMWMHRRFKTRPEGEKTFY
ncbi:LpxL/LpxP family Kdo(2)-lipid IV(A) lauroyl/palmitoleoyl acyltransferase [Psychromonas antarctica]|jgi:KDO2-lipid IV(A) lauroyltransferase|uniref:LpxL/LpxP family Kdo(2)-lipid IV(A) lauroyl/palmitoleoyl acyltransferase n=1 Tax=Psychromonas antarctica TaxID=67573 RepID=UPI001EE8A47D|nr:LpxL/LpxP family Kdo(2)-lipid IV(A) lauroyl/palmitoleoyl acyltransferase [Psychromonas antarctica]MCG6201588.1 LpxL/LpxP family Kdo(2)-lipid IV(A) lauroyl/palmitoleoyl acyltransferase [Psychromonas antarctica]